MLIYKNQDIFEVTRGILVHGCNCSGGFGSGIAGQIRKRYPQVYEAFAKLSPSPNLLGSVQVVDINKDFIIINGFTQLKFGADGKKYANPNAIWDVLYDAMAYAKHYDLPLISPKIGAGLGGLDWTTEVEPVYNAISDEFDRDIEVYYI